MKRAEDILDFWLGALDDRGWASDDKKKRWFMKDEAFDREIVERFRGDYDDACAGRLSAWESTPRTRAALVILLDQFPRNMFRGSAAMFGSDEQALATAKAGVAAGDDKRLANHERVFLYMPYMHAEDLEAQNQCVRLFQAFADELTGDERERILGNVGFAERHQVIVERFGRFPHRNETLGRASTPEEIEFLKTPGSGF